MDTEWVGGLFATPGYVTGEGGEPYRPEAVIWLIPQGPVLGMAMGRPGEGNAKLLESFETASRRPVVGPPHLPDRVRVASPDHAEILRKNLPASIEVICAPTPEFDEVMQSMRDYFQSQGEDEDEGASYLDNGIAPELMASFFRAAARLFRTSPWDAIPDDTSVLSVSCKALDLDRATLSIIGQLGESLGFLLFRSFDDFEQFIDEAEQAQGQLGGGKPPRLPAHFALNYEPATELHPALRKEASKHRWEVASPRAYPWMVSVDTDLVGRPPTGKEVTRTEAIVLALTELISSEPLLKEAWTKKKVIERTFSVKTYEGPFEVTLRAPHEALGGASQPAQDGEQGLFDEPRDEEGAIDEDWFEQHKEALLSGFEESPEVAPFEQIGWCGVVMDFCQDYLDVTVARMTPRRLEELLFEVIPKKLSAEPEVAPEIVTELRAFFTYLKRAHGLGNMDACLRVLGEGAARRLATEMADPRNFGTAKSFFMQGRAEGFDMSTREGIDAWMQTSNARQAGLLGAPAAPPKKSKEKTKTRAKAKAAKPSRKKNR